MDSLWQHCIAGVGTRFVHQWGVACLTGFLHSEPLQGVLRRRQVCTQPCLFHTHCCVHCTWFLPQVAALVTHDRCHAPVAGVGRLDCVIPGFVFLLQAAALQAAAALFLCVRMLLCVQKTSSPAGTGWGTHPHCCQCGWQVVQFLCVRMCMFTPSWQPSRPLLPLPDITAVHLP